MAQHHRRHTHERRPDQPASTRRLTRRPLLAASMLVHAAM
jgi:hypothetical protein